MELVMAEFEGDAVRVSRLRLKQAEEDFQRTSELRRKNLISESEYNRLKLENEVLKAELAKALQRNTVP
jgi:multidrug resistance efflux pump